MKTTIAVVIAVLAFFGLYLFFHSPAPTLDQYKKIESSLSLNDQQKAELPVEKGKSIAVYRYLSTAGFWQVTTHAPGEASPSEMKLGLLFSTPSAPDVAVPIYLCSYPGFGGENTSLDLTANCTGEGKLVQKEPLGYVSEKIRTGFRMMVRCRNTKTGFYVSLNSNCESAEDRVHGTLDAIMAVF